MDDSQPPVMISFDIKDGVGIDKIGYGPHLPYGYDILEVLMLHEFTPTAQLRSGLGILHGIGIQSLFLEDVHMREHLFLSV
jgi:hypothetical protein